MTKLAINTLKMTLQSLEELRDARLHDIGYHESELMKERTKLAETIEQITGLTATIELLEKV